MAAAATIPVAADAAAPAAAARMPTGTEYAPPTQDQLYAVFMSACGFHRVRKPSKHITQLLDPHAPTPLSHLPAVPMGGKEVYWGNVNLKILLELMTHLPHIEEVDWSSLSLYDSDAYKLAFSGNELVGFLCDWAASHANVRRINLRNQPVGTEAGRMLRDLLAANGNIVALDLDEAGVDAAVLKALKANLERNQAGKNPRRPPTWHPSAELATLEAVDRKSSCARRELHVLLWDRAAAFPTLEEESEKTKFVFQALKLTTAECEARVRGLRGDGNHLWVVESGELTVTVGSQKVTLGPGDYFGEPEDAVLFVAGQLSVTQRGSVFAVPLAASESLTRHWSAKVAAYHPVLAKVAAFQGLPTWCLLRLCHEARPVAFAQNELAVVKSKPFQGLFVVTKGSFLVRGRAKKGQASVKFEPGDVFGEEAFLSRFHVSSVDIKAVDEGGNECLLVSAFAAAAHVLPLLRAAMTHQAREYSEVQ